MGQVYRHRPASRMLIWISIWTPRKSPEKRQRGAGGRKWGSGGNPDSLLCFGRKVAPARLKGESGFAHSLLDKGLEWLCLLPWTLYWVTAPPEVTGGLSAATGTQPRGNAATHGEKGTGMYKLHGERCPTQQDVTILSHEIK